MSTPEGGNQYPATLEEAVAQGYPMPQPVDEESVLRERYPEAFWPTIATRRHVDTAVCGILGLPELPRISGTGRIIKGKYGKHGRTAGREISSAGAETITFLTDPSSHFED